MKPSHPAELRRRFDFQRLLGRGGQGTVVAAVDRELGRPVALKLLPRAESPVVLERFRREVRAMARLSHPGLPIIYSHGVAEGVPYLVTELLEGAPLHQLGDTIEPREVMLSVAEALDAIHQADLIHRDVKPQNIFRTDAGRVVLLDFGLVYDPERTRLTLDSELVGTLSFLAPELLRAASVSPAVDWYGWGATYYLLLEGRPPFEKQELLDYAGLVDLPPVQWRYTSGSSAEVALIERCLSGNPRARPASVREVRAALLAGSEGVTDTRGPVSTRRVRRGGRPRSRNLGTLVATLGFGLLLALGARWARPPAIEPAETSTGIAISASWEATLFGLEHEIEVLERSWVDAEGTVVLSLPAEAPLGTRPLLDTDPVRWGVMLRNLPRLQAFQERIMAGEDLDALPPPVRERLERLDRIYRDIGLPRPFFPHLYVEPTRVAVQVPKELRKLLGEDRVDGWLATCVRAWRRADSLRQAREQSLRDMLSGRPPPEELAQSGMSLFGFGLGGLRHTLEQAVGVPARRIPVLRWMRPGAEDLHTLLLAGQRLACLPGEEGERLGLLAADLFQWEMVLMYSYLAALEPEQITLAASATPACDLFYASMARRAAEAREQAGLDSRSLRALEVTYLLGALGPRDEASSATAPGSYAELRRARAVASLLRVREQREQPREVASLFRSHEELLYRRLSGTHLRVALRRVVRAWLHEGPYMVPAKHLGRLVAWVAAHPPRYPGKRGERTLEELVRALTASRSLPVAPQRNSR